MVPQEFMENAQSLNIRIKKMMVENLMLQVTENEIADDQPLFGPGSLGLDSVDALQLVVALDKSFGLKIPDPATAKEVLQSVNTMAAAIRKNGAPPADVSSTH
jgi:acyl carrier protein